MFLSKTFFILLYYYVNLNIVSVVITTDFHQRNFNENPKISVYRIWNMTFSLRLKMFTSICNGRWQNDQNDFVTNIFVCEVIFDIDCNSHFRKGPDIYSSDVEIDGFLQSQNIPEDIFDSSDFWKQYFFGIFFLKKWKKFIFSTRHWMTY